MLRLFDTATREVAELPARPDGSVGLYVCGPTVYAPPHIGHARTVLVYDVVRRYLEHCGYNVRHVCNVTDVDDKIINRANAEGRQPSEVAEEAEAQWWEAMDSVGALRPHDVPHATAYVEQMVELVGELVARGAAYEGGDGVYLSVASVPGYGLLPHLDPEELRAGARIEVGESKRAPGDFALWKAAKPGEPSWPSPFGDGRPGWHTECVVMSLSLLGEGFSLHGGGTDLIFPHHENERAQAVALGRRFARHWMHSGMVESGNEKMAKSLGNTRALSELVAGADPRAYRLLVLQSHYRSPVEVTEERIDAASRSLERIDALARRLGDVAGSAVAPPAAPGGAGATSEVAGRAAAVRASFCERMDDDLDTPGALAGLFEAIREANAALDAGDAAAALATGEAVTEMLGAVGVSARGGEAAPAELLDLARDRQQARAGGDYATADDLRARIEQAGWQVEDTPAGPKLRRRTVS